MSDLSFLEGLGIFDVPCWYEGCLKSARHFFEIDQRDFGVAIFYCDDHPAREKYRLIMQRKSQMID